MLFSQTSSSKQAIMAMITRKGSMTINYVYLCDNKDLTSAQTIGDSAAIVVRLVKSS
jgi:hypothetical protein